MLKGDLNVCMKGSRVFAPDFLLATFAFYFGFAFSPSFWAVLFSLESVSACEPFPAAGCARCRAGQGPGTRLRSWRCREPPGTMPEPRPGDAMPSAALPSLGPQLLCLCFLQAFLLMFHTFRQCSTAAGLLFFLLLYFLHHKSHLSVCLLLEALFLSSSPFL